MNLKKVSFWVGKILVLGAFIYFGFEGILNPETFASYIPVFVSNIIPATTVVTIHGIFEIACALLILFGIGGKWPMYILLLVFIGVLVSVSGMTRVRDFAILGGLLLLFSSSLKEKSALSM